MRTVLHALRRVLATLSRISTQQRQLDERVLRLQFPPGKPL